MTSWCRIRRIGLILWLGVCSSASASEGPTPPKSEADVMVREALRAVVAGQSPVGGTLFETALKVAPEHTLANWYAGRLQANGKWSSIDQLTQQTQQDLRLAEYRRLRDSVSADVQGQLLLARFCRKHSFTDRARLHWSNVLQVQPQNKEAIAALGLRLHRGMLLTKEQTEQYDRVLAEQAKAEEHWTKVLAGFRSRYKSADVAERDSLLRDLQGIGDPQAIPFLERELSMQGEDLALVAVGLLGGMEHEAATISLVRHAVLGDSPAVREAASERLKTRPLFSFVPVLMGTLATPIEFSFAITPISGAGSICVAASYHFYQEGPLADFSAAVQSQTIAQGRNQTAARRLNPVVSRNLGQAASFWRQTSILNAQTEILNERIDAVLTKVTGVACGGRPQDWWNWWQEYNDLYAYDEKPVAEYTDYQVQIMAVECFCPGTSVWSDAGPVPIERLRIGDRVLSQDPDTGELAYKLVMQVTVRPESPTLRVMVPGEEIVVTRGHPLWVVGKGWQMARHLEPGCRLHAIPGPVAVESVVEGPSSHLYNLVVADFNTYFVGQNKVLVHDNTCRRPTRAVLPGFVNL